MRTGIVHTLSGATRTARTYGLFAAAAYVFDEIRVTRAERVEGFDQRYGTTTEGKMYSWQLSGLDKAAVGDAHPYEATPAALLRKALRSRAIDATRFVFVDLGSGMGRTLWVASEFSFSSVVGIELSPELSDTAARNVDRYMNTVATRSSFDLRCMDASRYEFENKPLVVYLANSFGKRTFDIVFSRLENSLRSRPREVYFIYLNPRFEKRLKRSPSFKRLKIIGSRLQPWRHLVVYKSAA